MSNIHEKNIQITTTFDEMIARWKETGFYSSSLLKDCLITDLELLKKLELFFNDLEVLKTNLFIERGSYIRNTEFGIENIEEPKKLYIPTQYAKKWFPFTFIFENFFYRNQIEEFMFLEVSQRFRLFYFYYNLSLVRIRQQDNEFYYDETKRDDIPIFRFQSMKVQLSNLPDIHSLDSKHIELINLMVHEYRVRLKEQKKYKNIDSSFNKKRNEYICYTKDLLAEFGGLHAFSMEFFLENDYHRFDYSIIKSKFLNRIRSIGGLDVVVGYLGNWEFNSLNGIFFRVVFFVPKKKVVNVQNVIDLMIYHWEIQGDVSDNELISKIRFKAKSSCISASIPSLNTVHCVIRNEKSVLFDNFVNSVINYTTLTEKYFFPAELQIFIFTYMPKDKKKQNEKGQYDIENLKYGFSRSFRGHVKKPKN